MATRIATNLESATEHEVADESVGVGTGELVVTNHDIARRDERGMVSAEWAVGIIAAIAIAGVLVAVVTNGEVEERLLEFVLRLISWFADPH